MLRRRRPGFLCSSLSVLPVLLAGPLFGGQSEPKLSSTAPTASAAAQADAERELKRLVDVYALAERYAADPVSPDAAIYQGAIPGLLHHLDPHSVFFDPGQFE